jgi:hypothetical protein
VLSMNLMIRISRVTYSVSKEFEPHSDLEDDSDLLICCIQSFLLNPNRPIIHSATPEMGSRDVIYETPETVRNLEAP